MRLHSLLLAVVVTASAFVRAAPQATFRSSVSLLQVDVTVLDKNGAPVPGLTADDFTVTLNGKAQPVRTAAFVEASSASGGGDLNAHGMALTTEASNTGARGEPRLFVILADDLSISPLNGKGLFVAGERFLQRVPSNDLVGLTTTSGLGRTINPTKDHASVEAVLRRTFGGQFDPRKLITDKPFVGMNEALEVDFGLQGTELAIIQRECAGDTQTRQATAQRLDTLITNNQCAEEVDRRIRRTAALARRQTTEQIAAYVETINAMKRVPGIKHLVILTGGMPLFSNAIDLTPVARAAAAAGVQLTVMGEEPESTPGSAEYKDDRQLLSWAQTMTDMAGGQFFNVIGQGDRFFDRVLLASSALYRLGVELPSNLPPGAEVKVQAETKRPGLTTLASHLSATPSNAKPAPPDERMKTSISSGRLEYGVPVRLGATFRRLATDVSKVEVLVSAVAPASVRGPLNTMFGLVDATGKITSGKRTVPSPDNGADYRVAFSLPVDAGRYTLRFAVADADGNVGSVELPIDAALTPGPIPASALLLWYADEKGQAQFVALEDLPPGLTKLQARLDLYTDGAAPAGTAVTMTLTKSGDARPRIAGHAPLTLGRTGVTRADATFPIDKLEPGAYTISAAIETGGRIGAEVSARIRIR